jgi:hypothetical protein
MQNVKNQFYSFYLLDVGLWLALSSTSKIEPKRPSVQSDDFQRTTLRYTLENTTPDNLTSYYLTNVLKDPTSQTYRRINITFM